MAGNTKVIKNRIKSIKNTKKITKAMEMIAAVKMRKAVQAAINSREYASIAKELMNKLSDSNIEHPLARTTFSEGSKDLMILVTSNKGLCGSYNTKVMKHAEKHLEDKENLDFIGIGMKSGLFAKRHKLNLIQLYEKVGENPVYQEILSLADFLSTEFIKGKYKHVSIFYTDYISGLVQEPTHRTVLPISHEVLDDMIQSSGDKKSINDYDHDEFSHDNTIEYEFEPDNQTVLNYVLPLLVEIILYQALLESAASEHSSRMFAMKNASDSASSMIDSLTLEYNKGRQSAITQEISEIVGGVTALE